MFLSREKFNEAAITSAATLQKAAGHLDKIAEEKTQEFIKN